MARDLEEKEEDKQDLDKKEEGGIEKVVVSDAVKS